MCVKGIFKKFKERRLVKKIIDEVLSEKLYEVRLN